MTCGAEIAALGPACALHVDVPAAGACVRCGSFACAGCLGTDGLCAPCRLRENPALERRIRRLRGELIAVALGVVALMALVVTVNALERHGHDMGEMLVGAVAVSLAPGVAALVLGLSRGRTGLWWAVGIELLGLLPTTLAAMTEVGPCGLGLLVPFHALVRGVQLHRAIGQRGAAPTGPLPRSSADA